MDCNEGKLQEAVSIYAKGASPRVTKSSKRNEVTFLKPWALHVPLWG